MAVTAIFINVFSCEYINEDLFKTCEPLGGYRCIVKEQWIWCE